MLEAKSKGGISGLIQADFQTKNSDPASRETKAQHCGF